MLDIKRIRADFESVKSAVERRGQGDYGLDEVLYLDKQRRNLLGKVEQMRNEQSVASKKVPLMKQAGENVGELLAEMKKLSGAIKLLDDEIAEVEQELKNCILNIPNTPNEEVPTGKDDSDNVEIRRVGEPKEVDFEQKPHWDIGADLGILDAEREH